MCFFQHASFVRQTFLVLCTARDVGCRFDDFLFWEINLDRFICWSWIFEEFDGIPQNCQFFSIVKVEFLVSIVDFVYLKNLILLDKIVDLGCKWRSSTNSQPLLFGFLSVAHPRDWCKVFMVTILIEWSVGDVFHLGKHQTDVHAAIRANIGTENRPYWIIIWLFGKWVRAHWRYSSAKNRNLWTTSDSSSKVCLEHHVSHWPSL